MDGYHKLIRYGLIVHGCIDGNTRYINYLKLVNNNSSAKPLECIIKAVRERGIIPYRVRGDKGGENVLVADFMIHHRGFFSFICGPSKFNTRIERLWRDLRRYVIQYYMDLFKSMERNGMRIEDPFHMYVLQYLFMGRIQEDLDKFQNSFNHHKVRTEEYKSPTQLLFLRQNCQPPPVHIDDTVYGVDEQYEDDEEQDDSVQVPLESLKCPLSPENEELFRFRVDPLTMQNLHSELVQLYMNALETVYEILST